MDETTYQTEIKQLHDAIKPVGEAIIRLGEEQAGGLQAWNASSSRPNGLAADECAGFTTGTDNTGSLTMVLDVQAPAAEKQATLHLWAIKTVTADDGSERFYNIQFDFAMDYAAARSLTAKAANFTYDDLRTALQAAGTWLTSLTISKATGQDKAGQPVGERYSLDIAADAASAAGQGGLVVDWQTKQPAAIATVVDALNGVMPVLTEQDA